MVIKARTACTPRAEIKLPPIDEATALFSGGGVNARVLP